MKSILFLAFTFLLPFGLFSQTTQNIQLSPGAWGGELTYQNQTTEFYIDFRHYDDNALVAYIYMPVIPFPERSVGTVSRESSHYTAGPIQFDFDSGSERLTGSFPEKKPGDTITGDHG